MVSSLSARGALQISERACVGVVDQERHDRRSAHNLLDPPRAAREQVRSAPGPSVHGEAGFSVTSSFEALFSGPLSHDWREPSRGEEPCFCDPDGHSVEFTILGAWEAHQPQERHDTSALRLEHRRHPRERCLLERIR